MSALVSLDGEPSALWAVKVRGTRNLYLPYVCETELQALVLAAEHERTRGEPMEAVPVELSAKQL